MEASIEAHFNSPDMVDKTVEMWKEPGFVGVPQVTRTDVPDLTKLVPGGVYSLKVGDGAGVWEGFEKPGFDGEGKTLQRGIQYPDQRAMGLSTSLKSIRRKPS